MLKSIRFKASLLYTSILCLILVFFSAYLFHILKYSEYRNVQDDLRVKAAAIDGIIDAYSEIARSEMPSVSMMSQFLSQKNNAVEAKQVVEKLWQNDVRALGLARDIFRIIDPIGQPVLWSGGFTPEQGDALGGALESCGDKGCFSEVQLNGKVFYAINYPFMFADRNRFTLQLATPLEGVKKTLSRVLVFMVAGTFFVLLTTVFVGAFLTKKILRPVIEVTRMADNISQKNLGVRIAGVANDDEMGLLVASFNHMIERLEKSFRHINEFSSQVAHELKTPLAIMKGELELALASSQVQGEEARVMTVTLQEVDRLTRIIKDLLLLARLEYRLDVFKMEPIKLCGFIREIALRVQGLIDEKQLSLVLDLPESELMVRGDLVHLKRLFFNLLHNAIKFTPVGGEVRIRVYLQKNKTCVDVSDNGEGISSADQAKVFEKFYRVQTDEQQNLSGTGLGLPMVASIAKAHGGEVLLKSERHQGSTFTVILPR